MNSFLQDDIYMHLNNKFVRNGQPTTSRDAIAMDKPVGISS